MSAESEAPETLDVACEQDLMVRQLVRVMRDRPPKRLDEAVAELRELVGDTDALDRAAGIIVDLQRRIITAREPASVVAGGLETWYPGPRSGDRNWGEVVAILRDEGWDSAGIDQVDAASTKVVAHLPNPLSVEPFRCAGLVLGYVQSGKTTNFTSVIAKAADAGYKLFIVLSGIHDGLRQQTQDRLNEQLWSRNKEWWHRLTDEVDFRPTANVDALLASASKQSILAVVKKNGPRLRALSKWLFGARRELLARCPVLIIDDEADQASVNTARADRSPSTINGLIRSLLDGLPQATYVGYTATPFANVLIDPSDESDLYPRDFIVDLPKPTQYIGPETIFGREPLAFDEDGDAEEGSDLIRSIPVGELDELRPKGAASRHAFEPALTDSLAAALRYFVLSTAARRVRGAGNRHCTMLVHTSQFTDVHGSTARVIQDEITHLSRRVLADDRGLLDELREQWRHECERVSASEFGQAPVDLEAIVENLAAVLRDLTVVVDNSRSTDRLDYEGDPKVVVAVGGNTLSRGLTLEGLAVSFFVRSASAYDTLLQMGRWFGYRKGYADVTRIWLPDEMREWFHHLATVEREIRMDIERYEIDRLTPLQVGVRIRTHPKLAITAASKMQKAIEAEVSYSGRRLQTILFNHRDPEWLRANLEAVRRLLGPLNDQPRPTPPRPRRGVVVLGPVASRDVLAFLARYRFHENSRDLNSDAIRAYIEARMADGELTHFRIAVMGRSSVRHDLGAVDVGLSEPVAAINRARLDKIGDGGYADIKALMSRVDRAIDLDVDESELAAMNAHEVSLLRNSPHYGPGDGIGRGDGSGLLSIYAIGRGSTPASRGKKPSTRVPLDAVDDVVGLGLTFPVSASRIAVGYRTADLSDLQGDVSDDIDPDEGRDIVLDTEGSG